MKNVAKALIYDKNGKLLVLRRSGTHPRYAYEADLPGGEIEEGEDPIDALQREITEETGLFVAITMIQFTNQRITPSRRIDEVYTVRVEESEPQVTCSWEHKSYAWVTKINKSTLDTKDDYMQVVYEYLFSS